MRLSQYLNIKKQHKSLPLKSRSLTKTQTSKQKCDFISQKHPSYKINKQTINSDKKDLQQKNKSASVLSNIFSELEKKRQKNNIAMIYQKYSGYKFTKNVISSPVRRTPEQYSKTFSKADIDSENFNEDIIKKRIEMSAERQAKKLMYLKNLAYINNGTRKNPVARRLLQSIEKKFRGTVADQHKDQIKDNKIKDVSYYDDLTINDDLSLIAAQKEKPKFKITKKINQMNMQTTVYQSKETQETIKRRNSEEADHNQTKPLREKQNSRPTLITVIKTSPEQEVVKNVIEPPKVEIIQQVIAKVQTGVDSLPILNDFSNTVVDSVQNEQSQKTEMSRQAKVNEQRKSERLETKLNQFKDKLNLIGQTIAHGMTLKGIKGIDWMLPCYFLYQRFYNFRKIFQTKCRQRVGELSNTFVNEISDENEKVKQSLERMKKICAKKHAKNKELVEKLNRQFQDFDEEDIYEYFEEYKNNCHQQQFSESDRFKVDYHLLEMINSILIIQQIEGKPSKAMNGVELEAQDTRDNLAKIIKQKYECMNKDH